jgi:hypothetical protein
MIKYKPLKYSMKFFFASVIVLSLLSCRDKKTDNPLADNAIDILYKKIVWIKLLINRTDFWKN